MKCPQCKKLILMEESNPSLPFCSKRCKMVDLGKWLDEKYVVPDDSQISFQNPSDENKV